MLPLCVGALVEPSIGDAGSRAARARCLADSAAAASSSPVVALRPPMSQSPHSTPTSSPATRQSVPIQVPAAGKGLAKKRGASGKSAVKSSAVARKSVGGKSGPKATPEGEKPKRKKKRHETFNTSETQRNSQLQCNFKSTRADRALCARLVWCV